MDDNEQLEKNNSQAEDPNIVEHKIENIIATRDLLEQQRKEVFERKMEEDIDFRRDHYMSLLEKAYNMIPIDAYFKAEYEEIKEKYNSLIDRMEKLESKEELEACISEFEQYKSKKFDSKKVYRILFILFIIVVIGIVVGIIIGVNK